MGNALPNAWRDGLLREAGIVSAYAKINLTFEVLGRRTDGLHEVSSVMQTISLADDLHFSPAADLELRHHGLKPDGEDDLILRAARLLRERAGVSTGCRIECTKRIPVAAGLGGGSADAAATLRALNELWCVGLDAAAIIELAAQLGADVPFLIEGGTALATGTGRDLSELADAPPHWVVLVPIAAADVSKTAEMYRRLQSDDMTDGRFARRQSASIANGYLDYSAVTSAFNRAAAEQWPATRAALDALRDADADCASVSGAGPSVFGLYEKRASALAGLAGLRARGIGARLYRFTGRRPSPSLLPKE